MPRGEVGQARPRRSRGAAVGERAGPSGAVPPPPRGGTARDPSSPTRAPPGDRGEAPPRRAWCGPTRPYLPSMPAAAGPTWLRRGPGCASGAGPPRVTSPARAGSAAGLLPGGGAAALPPLRPGGPLGAGQPARLDGGAARGEALCAALPGCARPVTPAARLRLLVLRVKWPPRRRGDKGANPAPGGARPDPPLQRGAPGTAGDGRPEPGAAGARCYPARCYRSPALPSPILPEPGAAGTRCYRSSVLPEPLERRGCGSSERGAQVPAGMR